MSIWLCLNILYLLILNILLQIKYNNVYTIISLCFLGAIISAQIISKLLSKLEEILNKPYFEVLQELVLTIISSQLECFQNQGNFQGETLFQINFICLHSFIKIIKMDNFSGKKDEALKQLYYQVAYIAISYMFYGFCIGFNGKLQNLREIMTYGFYSIINLIILIYIILIQKKFVKQDIHKKKIDTYRTIEMERRQNQNCDQKILKKKSSKINSGVYNIYDFYLSKQRQLKQNSGQLKAEKKQIDALFPITTNISSNGIIIIEKAKQQANMFNETNQELRVKFMNKFIENIFGVVNEEELMKYLMTSQDMVEEDYKNLININLKEQVRKSGSDFQFNGQKIKNVKRTSEQIQNSTDLTQKRFSKLSENSPSVNKCQNYLSVYKDSPVLDIKPKTFELIKLVNQIWEKNQFKEIFSTLDLNNLVCHHVHCRYLQKKVISNNLLMQKTGNKLLLEFKIAAVKMEQNYVILLCRNVGYKEQVLHLKEQSESKSKTISFVSHEFRTPLNCIITMLQQNKDEIEEQMISQGLDQSITPYARNSRIYITSALDNAKYLLNLSNDLLDLAQMKVNKFQIHIEKFQLKNLCQEILQMFELQAANKQIYLNLEYHKDVPEMINQDKNRIKQIIINLLSNAFKFTQEGGVSLILERVKLRVYKVMIQDTGLGIKDEDQDKLFKAFGKINSEESLKLNSQGVGLGLLISNQIAMQLNNEDPSGLKFKSTFMKGSSFWFLISDSLKPCEGNKEISEKDEVNSLADLDSISVKTPLKDKVRSSSNVPYKFLNNSNSAIENQQNVKQCICNNILIVDDTQFNIEALKIQLKKMVHTTIDYSISGILAEIKIKDKTVSNSCLSQNCSGYQLIFMDVEMPQQDGIETTKKIKQLYADQLKNKIPPIIIGCSGYESDEVRKQCFSAGMTYFLSKPIQRKDLQQIIEEIFPHKNN